MLRINTAEIIIVQSLDVPFNVEQAINVDPIGDYIIKDGINAYNFKRMIEILFKIIEQSLLVH